MRGFFIYVCIDFSMKICYNMFVRKMNLRVEIGGIKMTVQKQYNQICRYLATVRENGYENYELYELIEYDPSMPSDIKEWLKDDTIYNFVSKKLENMKLRRELKDLQKTIDKQTRELNKAAEEFFYGKK